MPKCKEDADIMITITSFEESYTQDVIDLVLLTVVSER